jgi:phage-related protein
LHSHASIGMFCRVERPAIWIGSSLDDLKEFPEDVKAEMGHAIGLAQAGKKYIHAKPLKGFGGAGVLEVVSDHDGDTYRAVYTVRFEGRVYVLHAFQKKSKKGIATPKAELETIKRRLRVAEEHYAAECEGEKP